MSTTGASDVEGGPSLLRRYFDQYKPTQSQILQHFLGRRMKDVPSVLDDALLVTLDMEWFEFSSDNITELGLTIIDLQEIPQTVQPWEVLKYMRVGHIRIKETAHMVNKRLCPSRPDMFQFGQTRFVTMDEARGVLYTTFLHLYPGSLKLRPIIFLGHAVDNDVRVLKKNLGVDLDTLGFIVTTLDTQIMYEENPTTARHRPVSLTGILKHFGIREQFLHTAGNDAAYTTIASFLIAAEAMGVQLEIPPRSSPATVNQDQVKSSKIRMRSAQSLYSVGIPLFCTRCDSTQHFVEDCYAPIMCDICAKSVEYNSEAQSHATEKCTLSYIIAWRSPGEVIPCQLCAKSENPMRYTKAYSHLRKDCFYRE